MTDFNKRLDQYADLLVRVGINLQPGQELIITSSIEHADLARRVVAKAYDAGARRVSVDWSDPQTSRMTLARADAEALGEYPAPLAKWREEHLEKGGAQLAIVGNDPKLMAGIDPQRISTLQQATARATQAIAGYTATMRRSWSIGAAAVQGWADSAMAHLPAEERVPALWDAILKACRVYGDNDPVADWQVHLARLAKWVTFLNEKKFARLHYKGPGTDLVIDLPQNHVWISAGNAANEKGVPFCPNMPTEEVFTAPAREGVNGVVRSTLPLNYGGTLIKELSLRFEKGRVVAFSASEGQEVLQGLFDTDEGARYLGEVALVPIDSPINQTGILFYNTLFDENASCHLAVGRAYPICVEGGGSMSSEQRLAAGLNQSVTHVDFMIGSPALDIDGELPTGELVPLFRKGMWV